jgi:phage terminase large subunit GpA-like protein
VKEWLEAQGKPEQLKVFWNTLRGLPWEEEGIELDQGILGEHVERYPCLCKEGEHRALDCVTRMVPGRAALITRWVDTQDDRLEMMEWAWGGGEEAWRIDLEIIPGDPGIPENAPGSPWTVLAERLGKTFRHEYGAPMTAAITGVDARGHHAKEVYAFTKRHITQRVYATMGSTLGEGVPILGKVSRNNAARVSIYPIGVFAAKEAIMSRFAKIGAHGPGYIHVHDGIEPDRLKQFASEKLVTRYVGGRPKRVWIKDPSVRNEELDGLVGNMAMLHALGVTRIRNLKTEAEGLREFGAELRTPPDQSDAPPAPDPDDGPADERPRRGWMQGYR